MPTHVEPPQHPPAEPPAAPPPGAATQGPQPPQSAPAGAAPKRGLSPKTKRGILIIVAIIVALIFAYWYFLLRGRSSTDDAEIQAHVDPISPRVAGTVTHVYVDNNDFVHAGQVLYTLDPRSYQLALNHAEAELVSARAAAAGATTGVPIQVTTSHSGISSAQAGLITARAAEEQAKQQLARAESQQAAAQAAVAEAQANAARAQSDEKRYAQLVAKSEVSRQNYEHTVTAATAAQAAVRAAQADYAAAQNAVGAASAGVSVARGKVEQALAAVRRAAMGPQEVSVSRSRAGQAAAAVALQQAAVAQAQLNLEWTTVRAPVPGLIGGRHVEVGQAIAPGQPGLDIVESGRPLVDRWVVADYKETELAGIAPGDRATVHVDAYNEDLKARLNSIGSATGSRFSLLPPENATGNYVKVVQRVPVKVFFDPGQDAKIKPLRPGMSVEVTIFKK
ncbi:MAG: biotin/lipoyl-binding protein [Terriglobales bacterium]